MRLFALNRDLSSHDSRDHVRTMFAVDEPTAAAIRKAYVESGELSAVVELRRHFPGIVDNENARHHVATATTPMLKYRSDRSTIPFLDTSREGGNGRTACHRCTKEQASRTSRNATPT